MTSREKKLPIKRDESVKSEILHRLKTHPFLFTGTVVVLVIVIVAFVFVPAIVPSAQRGEDRTLGYYNNTPIKNVHGNYFNNTLMNLSRSYQPPSTDDAYYRYWVYQLWRMAFEETVIHYGILDETKQAGYIIPKEIVDREVAKLPEFQDNGRFSSALYRSLDNISRMNLWSQVQDNLVKRSYITDLAGLRTASKEASFISSMASRKRTFDAAVFPMSLYPDSEVVSFAMSEANAFRMVHLSKITLYSSGDREARQILGSVKDGISTFEDAARNSSQDEYAEKGGDMGIRMAYELNNEIGDQTEWEKIVNMARGEISDLIKIPAGWAFFRAEESPIPPDLNDAAQVETIRNYIMRYFRGRIEDWLIAEAERFSLRANEIGFEDAVYEANITRHSFGPVPINYGDSSLFDTIASAGVPELQSAGTNQFFWRLAFSTPINTISRPLVVGDNVIVLLPLQEIIADQDELQSIESVFNNRMDTDRIDESVEATLRSYFLKNDKLEDHFEEIFWKPWGTD